MGIVLGAHTRWWSKGFCRHMLMGWLQLVITQRLAIGGQGTVFLGLWKGSLPVAVKVLLMELLPEELGRATHLFTHHRQQQQQKAPDSSQFVSCRSDEMMSRGSTLADDGSSTSQCRTARTDSCMTSLGDEAELGTPGMTPLRMNIFASTQEDEAQPDRGHTRLTQAIREVAIAASVVHRNLVSTAATKVPSQGFGPSARYDVKFGSSSINHEL